MTKKNPAFVHLHVHTEYSMLDGLNRIPKMIKKVKESGMNALALSDHGVMYGLYEFWTECKKAEIKPIIGCEIYVSPKERTLRQEVNGIKYYHLLLLAKNKKGFQNLIKLVSIGHLEGMYYKPRVDKEILEKYSEGIICTSACVGGPLGKHIYRNENKKAVEWLEFLKETYGKDFYLELQRHGLSGSDEIPKESGGFNDDQFELLKIQSKINKQLIKWSKKYKIPLVGTTDAHYLDEEDEFTQEVLFAIKDGKTLDDPTRRLPYKHTYIKTPEEMAEVFSDIPEALANTQKIADSVEGYDITYDRVQPQFPDIPKGKTSESLLREMTLEGAKQKYPKLTKELKERIDFELDIIHDKGYDDYFLVVSDMMKWARSKDILVGSRGSVGGSVIAYCLDVINIDPIKWECYFERFLNPERPSPPDIDMDIQDSRRDEVMAYVTEKYGSENVCAIAAFGRLKTRSAIRDVCRAMGIDLQVADTLSKMIEVKYGKPFPIAKTMETNPPFARIINSDPQLQQMAQNVEKIEGISRHVSTHACGYLITPDANINYIPLQYETGSKDKIITQMEFTPLENMGLMKFDFLGLANFSIISYAINLIKTLHGTEIDIYNIPEDDKDTFELFKRGDTTSVFQFESSGMKRYLRELVPENLEDLCFMVAGYRPGPMEYIQPYIDRKMGREKVEYLVPELEPILNNTYGIAIYQEQILRIAVDLAGYSMGNADKLRKGMGKKIQSVIDAEKPKFIQGCKDNGYSEKIAEQLWDYLLPFANYGFNKAHAATYALIGYWTGYLKAHYPLEFMCARLTADMDKPDKLTVALEEAKNIGLELLPPNVNKSFQQFSPEGEESIRYGLNGIKNVGHNVIDEIVEDRTINGNFKSLDDLCTRIPSINSRTLEALIKVGALKDFGYPASLLAVYQSVLSSSSSEAKKRSMGQLGIFSAVDTANGSSHNTPLPQVEPVPTAEKLKWEKELLGIYFSAHPMQAEAKELRKKGIQPLTSGGLTDGKTIKGCCLIINVKPITTKKGDPMAFLALDDMSKTVDAVLFPRDYKRLRDKLIEGEVVIVEGKCNQRNGDMNIIINSIEGISEIEIDQDNDLDTQQVTLHLRSDVTSNDLSQLRDILIENPGNIAIMVHINHNGKIRKFKMKRKVDEEVITTIIEKLPMVEKVIH